MRTIFYILVVELYFLLVPNGIFAQKSSAGDSFSYKEVPVKSLDVSYTRIEEPSFPIELLTKQIESGEWHLIQRQFSNPSDFKNLISHFTTNAPSSVPLLFRIAPLQILKSENNVITVKNIANSKKYQINFNLGYAEIGYRIEGFSIEELDFNKSRLTNSKSYFNSGRTSETIPSFIELPTSIGSNIKYHYNLLSAYDPSGSRSTINEFTPFKQIDFAPLNIEFKWCKEIIFGIKVCGTETKTFTYGKVLAGNDIPGNETEFSDRYFDDLVDITAFSNPFSSSYTQFAGIILTSVIVDRIRGELSFFREGIDPFKYGKNTNDFSFTNPIGAKYIGGFLYILERGDYITKPAIKILKINHSPNGDFNIEKIGIIETSILGGYEIDEPTDLAGYEEFSNNVLLFSDKNGLHALNIDKGTGLPTIDGLRTYKAVQDKINTNLYYDLKNIRRFDSDTYSGSTVVLTNDNQIISFSNLETNSSNTNDFVLMNWFKELSYQFSVSNLGYMITEKRWYITDKTGKLHTLDENGRYISNGGKYGDSEDNGELYSPIGITPNPITNLTNDFRYRFIVANQWGYTTGFKLFAPDFTIPDFKVFENSLDKSLNFTFTTSTKWQAVEKCRGLTFQTIRINGINIDPSKWNSQIVPGSYDGTTFTPGDELLAFPNVITLSLADIPNLKRGWNKAYIAVTLFKQGESNETVEKEIDFYWLPDTYTPVSLGSGNFKINLSHTTTDKNGNISSFTTDYIYKPITLGDKGALYISAGNLKVAEFGYVEFQSGSTFYNESNALPEISNISFENGGDLTFESGSFICVKSSSSSSANGYTLPNLSSEFILQDGYKIGVNPDPSLSFPNNSCVTPCQFLAYNHPKPIISSSVNVSSQPFIVTVDASSSTYATRLRWEVDRVLPGGSTTGHAMVEVVNPNGPMNLTSALGGYEFLPCSFYNITLTLGCYDGIGSVTWITGTTASQLISTAPIVNAGPDIVVCETSPTITLTGFSPMPSATGTGVWTGPDGFDTSLLTYSITGSSPRSTPLTFTYTYTDIYSCTGVDFRTLTIYPIPATPTVTNTGPVCENSSVSLSVTNSLTGALFSWIGPSGYEIVQTSASLPFINVPLYLNGDWQVSQTANGCTSSIGGTTLVVNPLPTLTVGGAVEYCIDSPIATLTGYFPTGGSWSGTAVTSNGLFTPSVAGFGVFPLTYSYTDGNGCTNTKDQSVTVGPLLDMGANHEICINGGLFTISGYSPIGGTWTGTGITNASGLFDPTIAGVGTFVVYYSFTDANGCTNSSYKDITVKAQPETPTATTSGAVCEGGTALLSATIVSGATYIWKGPSGFVNSAQNQYLYYVSLDQAGTYTVSSFYNGCSSDVSSLSMATLTVNPLPSINIGTSLGLCFNQSTVTLTGSPVAFAPATAAWSGQNITPDGIFTSEVSTTTSYVVRYTYTDVNGCTNSDDKSIVKYAYPTVSILSSYPSRICKNQFSSVQLVADPKADGPMTFQWSRNGTTVSGWNEQALTVTTSGLYCITVTNTCAQFSACYNLRVDDEPVFTLTAPSSMCVSGTTKNIGVNISNLDALYNYNIVWQSNYTPSSTSLDKMSPVANNFPLSIQYPGLYMVSVKDTYLNVSCLSTNTVNIIPNPLPSVDAGSPIDLCFNQSTTTLTGSPIAVSPATAIWSGSHISSNGIYSNFNSPPITENQTYIYTDANGCTNTASTTVTKHAYPTVNITSDSPNRICKKQFTSVQLTANNTGLAPMQYAWSKSGVLLSGTTSKTITATSSGLYCVTVTDFCTTFATCYFLNVIDEPIFTTTSPSGLCVSGSSGNIKVTIGNLRSGEDYNFSWASPYMANAQNFIATSVTSTVFNLPITVPGVFQITVGNTFSNVNCLSTSTVNVTPIQVPTVSVPSFSPICYNSTPRFLTANPPGGTWSGNGISSSTFPTISDDFSASSFRNVWTTRNVSNFGATSISLTTTPGKLTVTTRGNGITAFGNEYAGIYQVLQQSDFDVSVKIESQTNTVSNAQAGILAANSITALNQGGTCFVGVTPSTGFVFQYNKSGTVGRCETVTTSGTTAYPCWVRLKKTGVNFEAYYRTSTAVGWSQIGTSVSPLQTASYSQIAIIQTSRSSTITGTAVFDDFNTETPQVTGIFTPSLSLVGVNNLTYSYSNGCTASANPSALVVAEPTVYIGTSSSNTTCTTAGTVRLCPGQILIANVQTRPSGISGTFNYLWKIGSTSVSTTAIFTPTISGFYSVTVGDNYGCGTSTATVNVIMNVPPTVSIPPVSSTVCPGVIVNFNPLTVTGCTGITTMDWSRNGTNVLTDVLNSGTPCTCTSSISTISYSSSISGSYLVKVTDKDGCFTNYNFNIGNYPLPPLTITPSLTTVQAGDGLILTANGISGYGWSSSLGGISLQWQVSVDNGGSWSDLSNSSIYTGATTSVLGVNQVTYCLNLNQYRLKMISPCGNVISSTYILNFVNLPSIVQQPTNQAVCKNVSIIFNSSISGWGLSYQWQSSPDGSTWTNLSNTGTYAGVLTNSLSISSSNFGVDGIWYRVFATSTCLTTIYSNSALLTVRPYGIWIGTSNSDWFNETNWCNGLPTSTRDAEIGANTPFFPIITASGAACKNLLIDDGGTLSIVGLLNFSVYQNWTNHGKFSCTSCEVSFVGSDVQSISGIGINSFCNLSNSNTSGIRLASNVSVSGTMLMGESTSITTTGFSFTLVSTALKTARLDKVPASASWVGNLTMQRFVPAQATLRLMSSAVNGSTLQQWKSSIPISGPGGASNGFDPSPANITTVWYFDESINAPTTFRYVSAQNIQMPLAVGAGYRVFTRGDRNLINLFGTIVPSDAIMSVTNPPNIGNINFPVSYHDYGAPFRDGTCLIGNPYPSIIDWADRDGWTIENVDDGINIFDVTLGTNGAYYSYINGFSSPNRTFPGLIESSQAFFVKANALNPVLSINENAKSDNFNGLNVTHFRSSSSEHIRIRLSTMDSLFDETAVRFVPMATEGYDSHFDVNKIVNDGLNIYSAPIDGDNYSINSFQKPAHTYQLPLEMTSHKPGEHQLYLFDMNGITDQSIYLKDKLSDTIVKIDNELKYKFKVDNQNEASYQHRFSLIFNPMNSKNNFDHGDFLKIYPNPTSGTITIDIFENSASDLKIEITTLEGKRIDSFEYDVSNRVFYSVTIDKFASLPAGVYMVSILHNNKRHVEKVTVIH